MQLVLLVGHDWIRKNLMHITTRLAQRYASLPILFCFFLITGCSKPEPWDPVVVEKTTSASAPSADREEPGTNTEASVEPEDHEWKWRLVVDPADAPTPSLKHMLRKSRRELEQGNSAPHYYRAIIFMNDKREEAEKSRDYHEPGTPFSGKLTKEETRTYLKQFDSVFESLEQATCYEKVEWNLRVQDLKGRKALDFSLTEAQNSRLLTKLLTLKTSFEVSEGRFDDALATLRTGLRMAQDIARFPSAMAALVAIETDELMLAELRNFISTPGAPNLYWALSTLPAPLIDTRPVIEFELGSPAAVFWYIRDADQSTRTASEWNDLIGEMQMTLRTREEQEEFAGPPLGPDEKLITMIDLTPFLWVQGQLADAKERLLANGYHSTQLERMPDAQVVALHHWQVNRHLVHEQRKWIHLPVPQALREMRQTLRQLRKDGYLSNPPTQESPPQVTLLMPAVDGVFVAGVNLDARLAALRVIEAVRIHASQNNGHLPKSLSEITAVPVPDNLSTGEPFSYEVSRDNETRGSGGDPGGGSQTEGTSPAPHRQTRGGERAVLKVPGEKADRRRVSWHIELEIRKEERGQ